MGRRLRFTWMTAVLLTLAIGTALVFSSAAILLWTDWGHARVASILNRAISKQIAGELQVAHIEALSLSQLTASGIKILAPNGEPAIEAEHAVIDFSLSKLWAGEYGWSRADIKNCLVHVSEYKDVTNMEATFAERPGTDKQAEAKEKQEDPNSGDVDLQSMVTSDCTLLIGGGSLPGLRLVDLQGIMRVHVLPNGDTELRFDRYKGAIDRGLPMGPLDFHDVRGEVTTAGKRLLKFEGEGKTKATPVDFMLDIATQPKKLVKIDATFPEATLGSLTTLWVSLWTKFCPTIDLDVRYGKTAAAKLEKKVENPAAPL